MDLFSPAGIAAWQQRLDHSPQFAAAAGSWIGRILLVEQVDSAEPRRTWIAVEGGRCREARPGLPADEAAADFILAAAPATWNDLVGGRTTPASAAMLGRLSLLKGDVLALIPHAKAAAALLAAAGREPAE
jgi:hypothetical protein